MARNWSLSYLISLLSYQASSPAGMIWRGEIRERTKGRASLHTSRARVPEIVARAQREHPYKLPGVSTTPIDGGNPDYLAWIGEETGLKVPDTDHTTPSSSNRPVNPQTNPPV